MKKKKIWAFVAFFTAVILHVVLYNVSDFFHRYHTIFSAAIALTFSAVLFYFALCHTKGWHGAEKLFFNEWYLLSLSMLLLGLSFIWGDTVLKVFHNIFSGFMMTVVGFELYYKRKEKKYLLLTAFGLVLLISDVLPYLGVE